MERSHRPPHHTETDSIRAKTPIITLCSREHLYRCAKYPQPPSPPPRPLPKKSSHMSISTQKFTLSTYKCTMKPKNKPTTHFLKYFKFRQSWTKVLGTVRTQLQFYAFHKFCRKKQCCLFTNPCPLPPPHPIQWNCALTVSTLSVGWGRG